MNTPKLIPPSNQNVNREQKRISSNTLLLILSGIIVCLILIIFVMFLSDTPTSAINVKKIKKESITTATDQQEKQQSIRIFDEAIQIQWLIKKTEAEQENMPEWASEFYISAIKSAEKGFTYKQEKNYELAEQFFKSATDRIDDGFNEKEIIKNNLIAKAELEFSNGEISKSKNWFEKAQLVDKEDERIQEGLIKIKNRIEVIKHYNQSIAFKNENNYEQALTFLEKARGIEPENKLINDELLYIKDEIKDIKFSQTVNQVLKEIEQGNYNIARSKLLNAQKLKSDDPIINELEVRIKRKSEEKAINSYQAKAEKFEKIEDWQKAADYYNKINKIDPYTSSGKVNEQRARAYLELNRMLDQIILKPERLQNDKVLKNSIKTLANIKKEVKNNALLYSETRTPKLNSKIETANTIIKKASIEIPVTIMSDNMTDVSIYKIGQFGKLEKKNIILRPGNYTIVGSRKGYRDLRKKIQISASENNVIVYVQCREKI